jgi:hypothetical protein
MSFTTFKRALELDSESVAIGGGEPTVHPKFWQFLMTAVGACSYVWLATNGKRTEIALTLAGMAKKEVIGCELSQDEYHEPINPRVITAFAKHYRDVTQGGTQEPIRMGRAMTELDANGEGCCCSEMLVKPNGDVKWCGCEDAPVLGNVNRGFEYPENYNNDCWHEKDDLTPEQA